MGYEPPSRTTAPGKPGAEAGARRPGARRPLLLAGLALALIAPIAGCAEVEAVVPGPHEALTPGITYCLDLDRDGQAETLLIDGNSGSLLITDGDSTYRTRDKWRVVQASLGDTDHDALPEVVALLDADDGRHLGLFAFFGGEYRERLVTSALVPRPLSLQVLDSSELPEGIGSVADCPGDLVLLSEEGATEEVAGRPAGRAVIYRWNGFGFTAVGVAVSE